jgi:hypothetical protein
MVPDFRDIVLSHNLYPIAMHLIGVHLLQMCISQANVSYRRAFLHGTIQGHHNTPLHAIQYSGMPAVACWLKIGAGITVKSVTGLHSVVPSHWDHMGII